MTYRFLNKIAAILILALISVPVLAAESDHSNPWCESQGGETSVTMPDRTRADCELMYHIVEADWANKWYQAVGQSLHYSVQSGKLPAILLILKKEEDVRYVSRLHQAIAKFQLPITVYTVKSYEE